MIEPEADERLEILPGWLYPVLLAVAVLTTCCVKVAAAARIILAVTAYRFR